ncbi:MAG: hypothetical protein ACE5WD_08455 [Candidatus Aminicenantia bacterium]
MRKALFISGVILSFLILLITTALLIFFYKKPLIEEILEKYLSGKTGLKIEIGKLDYELFPLSIQINTAKVSRKIGGEETDIFLNQLNLEGEIRRLIKREKPFFESIKITGAKFYIKKEKKEKKRLDYQIKKEILKLSNILSYTNKIIIKDTSLSFISPFQSINLQRANFSLSNSVKKGEYKYIFTCEKTEIKNIDQNIVLNSSFHSTGKFSLSDLAFMEGEFLFRPLSLISFEKKVILKEITFNIRSEFEPDEKILFFPRFEINIPHLINARGLLEIDFRKDFSFLLIPKIHLEDLNKTYNLLRPYLSQRLKYLNIEGEAYLEGEYQYLKNSLKRKTNVKCRIKLEPTKINYSTASFSFNNLITGELKIKGPLSDIKLSGLIKITNGNLSKKDLKICNLSLEIPINKTSSLFNTSFFKGNLKSLTFPLKNKWLELNQLEFKGKGSYDFKKKEIDFNSLEFRVSPLPTFQIRSKINLQPQGEKYFHLKSSKVDITNLSSLFLPFLPEELIEWEPDGNFNIEMEVRTLPRKGNEWSFSGKLNLSEGMFHNPSFTFAGESLTTRIAFKGKYSTSKKSIPFSVTLNLTQGESLWNEFYLNWSENPFRGKMTGIYHIPLKELDELSIDTSFFSLGRIKAQGLLKFSRPFFMDLEVLSSQLNLNSLYSFFSQEETSGKTLLNLDGQAESQIHIKKGKDKLSLIGQFRIKNGLVEKKDKKVLIKGIEAKIPIYYERGIKKNDKKEGLFWDKGYFLAREFKTSYFSVSPLQINFEVSKNKFLIEPISIDIFGGKANLRESFLYFGSKLSDINGIFSLSLSNLNISKFPVKSTQFNLSGTAYGNLSPIKINSKMITTQGRVEMNIFDGKVTVKNIKIIKPFSKGRVISCDIIPKDLNLEKITNSIPFGQVTGIIKGEIKDLAFSYGQPERFVMHLESVRRKGIPQKFSFGAVNDLAVIGSGEGVSLSSKRGLNRFVSEFIYKKIGISCSLKNDMFTLRGTIREKGVEYLVKKSWLFGINVINRNPHNQISFKDMMSRLKRIGQSKKSQ